MSNRRRVLLDSSILVEWRKGTRTQLLQKILANRELAPCIHPIVVSEYLFHHLAIFGGKAPLTLKESGQVSHILHKYDPTPFLNLFECLPSTHQLVSDSISLMAKYNLLPNDAMILAACKKSKVFALASYDEDFIAPCKKENIRLFRSEVDVERVK